MLLNSVSMKGIPLELKRWGIEITRAGSRCCEFCNTCSVFGAGQLDSQGFLEPFRVLGKRRGIVNGSCALASLALVSAQIAQHAQQTMEEVLR